MNNLGTIYLRPQELSAGGARSTRRRCASRLSPLPSGATWVLATLNGRIYKHAGEAWEKALSLDPEVFENHSTQGVLIQQQTGEERAKFHLALARTYAKAGMDDRALSYIRKALEEGFREKKETDGRSGVCAPEGSSRVQGASGDGAACSVGQLEHSVFSRFS